ncbi:HYC_CC_PP family protein [Gaetbulibacter saemankumensis]|uniref:HYC_CC_PP family protein n=1 Tax=Gaetbulibacter saemankumensis TaxID=311208 RepID=UPI000489668A|nr:hypothetical protein [Gaetbulibacter saemankumensis]
MKQVFHKIWACLMAFIVLFSTMSFVVDMHYCGDTLVDTAIFQKAETCGMDMPDIPSETCVVTKKNCCTDKQLLVDGQEELQSVPDQLMLVQQWFVTSFVYAYMGLFEAPDNELDAYQYYSPPTVVKDIYKIDETYLI